MSCWVLHVGFFIIKFSMSFDSRNGFFPLARLQCTPKTFAQAVDFDSRCGKGILLLQCLGFRFRSFGIALVTLFFVPLYLHSWFDHFTTIIILIWCNSCNHQEQHMTTNHTAVLVVKPLHLAGCYSPDPIYQNSNTSINSIFLTMSWQYHVNKHNMTTRRTTLDTAGFWCYSMVFPDLQLLPRSACADIDRCQKGWYAACVPQFDIWNPCCNSVTKLLPPNWQFHTTAGDGCAFSSLM